MPSETIPILERTRTRLPRWMIAFGLAASVIALASGHGRFAAGLGLGAAVSILAYFWLHQVVATAFDHLDYAAGKAPKVPRSMVFKFAIRYPLALGAIYLFYRTHWLPFEAVLLGLFVPVAGALAECLLVLGEFIFRSKTTANGQ